ncbi:FtsX-like permease family protein [Stratiformator vulcanicus]|uniref:FtsX-like permease family protein n=1 Tax=Stratiformator vulcanicus TaxID=2527980 RepID=A0A517R0L9_9PLAN|nr:FtsX-like permease family protein [Stratiformator vulcanicus]QDT37442.1 FtsX-like permease family protein [Stratiformator vulcanicus]
MTRFNLVLHSLGHFWRTNLAVLLGVAVGAAVIGGALIVGDSVRASLRQITLDRLGNVDFAMSGTRFVTEDLADRWQIDDDASLAPAIAMVGGVSRESDDLINTIGNVNVYGVDERLWSLLKTGAIELPSDFEVVLNQRVAEELKASVGDEVIVSLELPSEIPRESLLGDRDETAREIALTVSAIIPDGVGAGRFGLNPGQQIPPVVFATLDTLQSELGLAAVRATRRNPTAKPARVNALFGAIHPESPPNDSEWLDAKKANALLPEANSALKFALTLDDLDLRIVPNEEFGYLALESRRLILEPGVVAAAEQAAEELGLKQSPVLVYLVNEIANAADPEQFAAYSVAAGIEFDQPPPFGPFDYLEGHAAATGKERISEGSESSNDGEPATQSPPSRSGLQQVVLNEFLANEQLGVEVGDEVTVKFYTVGTQGDLPEEEHRFRVSGIVKLEGTIAADRTLTPALEGITDADTFGDWEQPFDMDLDLVTPEDEAYWEEYRATPKLFLPLDFAQDLFQSRYGTLTSFRVSIPDVMSVEEATELFRRELLTAIEPRELGLAFRPVKLEGLRAAQGTQDFAGLFVGFSFFLILSAAILIGLLFRLGVEQRTRELGLLRAIGFTTKSAGRLLLMEGAVVVLLGGAIGTLAALGYAWLMIYGLRTWWVGAIGTRFLFLSPTPLSLMIGFVGSALLALLAVYWGLRRFRTLSLRELLAGSRQSQASESGGSGTSRLLAVGSAVGGACLILGTLIGLIPDVEAFGGISWAMLSFFVAGMLLLTASVAALSAWLERGSGSPLSSLRQLSARNAVREKQRSVMTTALVASATFVLVAVAAARMDPTEQTPRKDSGNGGFLLLSRSSVPLPYNVNTEEGRTKLGIQLKDPANRELFDRIDAYGFRIRPGDDASCLNLFRTSLPTVLGASDRMIERGGFAFTATSSNEPWQLLKTPLPDIDGKPVYPVFGDMNTLLYSLKKGVGDTIAVPSEENPEYRLQIVGMFVGSVFQGTLVMSEGSFNELYPDLSGYGWFLIEGPQDEQSELSTLLETKLAPYGFDTEPVSRRIADFLAVQNTYLSTFQALGGLGLLLGTVGLAVVMLRNVLERRSEIALMRAVGFRGTRIAIAVLIENSLLLGWGLVAGTASALLSLAPHLVSSGADVPTGSLALLLLAVFVVGSLASLAAVRAAVRTPIVGTLRGE